MKHKIPTAHGPFSFGRTFISTKKQLFSTEVTVMAHGRSSRPASSNHSDIIDPDKDADELTDEALAKQHNKHLLRGPQTRKNNKAKYNTARGQSIIWTPEDESQHEVKAFVRDTATLQASHKWEELVGKGITHLIIEDDENFLKEIPEEICQIQTLRSFKLMWSKVKVIPDHLLQIELKELCIHKCPLKSIEKIHRFENLFNLELVNNGLKKIPMEIGDMTNLRSLDLTGNHLKSLPISLGNLGRLQVLKICGNTISEIPASMTDLDRLTTFDCSQNHIKQLPTEIGNLIRLVTLRISHNQMSTLPPSFQKLHKLKHLYLGHNRFTEVPRLLGKLPGLQTLNMVSNHVKNVACAMTNLTTLLLDKNEMKELSESVFLCQKLEKLAVQYNNLETIPPLIAHLKKLRALYIGGNSITKLPEDLCTLTNLRHFVVRETKVQDLPSNFDQLHRLSMVDIEHTELDAMFSYRLKTDGIEGLLDQVRLKRESSGGETVPSGVHDNESDRGSSVFDSEDEAASADDLDNSDPEMRGVANDSGATIRSRPGYDANRDTIYPPDMLDGGTRRAINSQYPPSEAVSGQSHISQLQEMFHLPNGHPPKDIEKTMGKKEAEGALSKVTEEETSFVEPMQNGHRTSMGTNSTASGDTSHESNVQENIPESGGESSDQKEKGTNQRSETPPSVKQGEQNVQDTHINIVPAATTTVQETQDNDNQIDHTPRSPQRPLSKIEESRISVNKPAKPAKPAVSAKPSLAQKPSIDGIPGLKPVTSVKPKPPPVKPKPK